MATGIAPYEVNVQASDDETFAFVLEWEVEDGTSFPFDDYEIEYVVVTDDGSQVFLLTEGDGITIASGEVEFKKARGTLEADVVYRHGCRIRHLETEDEIQVFHGTIRVSQGHFS